MRETIDRELVLKDGYLHREGANLWFQEGTLPRVCDALEQAYTANRCATGKDRRGVRVRIWLGDVVTGKAWREEHDVIGYVGRTTGPIKVPILVYNDRSLGGGAIASNAIVRMDWTDGTCTLYRHPTFHTGLEDAQVIPQQRHDPQIGYWTAADVWTVSEGTVASFASMDEAKRWLDFMNGRRYRK